MASLEAGWKLVGHSIQNPGGKDKDMAQASRTPGTSKEALAMESMIWPEPGGLYCHLQPEAEVSKNSEAWLQRVADDLRCIVGGVNGKMCDTRCLDLQIIDSHAPDIMQLGYAPTADFS